MTPERIEKESQIRDRYEKLKSTLTERARRLFVANEAIAYGYGGIAAAARATGLAPSAIGRGIAHVRAIEDGTAARLPANRSRRPGGGRKKTTDKDPTLLPDLKRLVESTTRGDPQAALLWTARSQRNIVDALKAQGHHTSTKMVARLLKELGYSLQSNSKRLEGTQYPDVVEGDGRAEISQREFTVDHGRRWRQQRLPTTPVESRTAGTGQ